MEFIRGLRNLKALHHGCVLTVGNYDGLHRGHQAVIASLLGHAEALRLPSTLMTFEPMPSEFFDPQEAPPRLSSLREKIQDIAARGVDRMLGVRFDRAFASLAPEAFVRELLVERLGARIVLVGEDFRFGAERRGDSALLSAMGVKLGFEVAPMTTVDVGGRRVSSTRVRTALNEGAVDTARELLGRPYRISGRVAAGARLGRTLNMPTANIRMLRKPAPCFGVYAVEVRLDNGVRYPAAANLGTRPTVDGRDCLLEVHLLDFDGDLYGRRLDVFFHAFLRPEQRFDGVDALRTQMQADVRRTRDLLAGRLTATD